MIYLQQIALQKTFYSHFRGLGKQPRPFPFLLGGYDQYRLMHEVFQQLQPFQFLREGDRAIQVGFTDSYLNAGISHPLIMSAIVGESGHVWAIDLDKRNVDALIQYIEDNHVDNVTVIQAAIWKECAPVAFAIYDQTSTNTAEPIIQEAEGWFDRYVQTKPTRVVVDTVTLDLITGAPDMDFVNLTVNGAESACIQGSTRLMEHNPNIVFAFPAGNVRPGEFSWLEGMGFDVGLSHAPHAPWEPASCLYACAVRNGRDRLEALGFELRYEDSGALDWAGVRLF